MSKTTNKFSPEVRQRAIRMVLDHEAEHPSRWAAVSSIAAKIGCSPATLHEWVKKTEVDSGKRAGLPSDVAEKMKALERALHVRRPAHRDGVVHHSDRAFNTCPLAVPSDWWNPASSPPLEVLATAITTRSQKRLIVFKRPWSFIGVDLDAASTPMNSPLWHGSTATAIFWSQSEISRQLKSNNATAVCGRNLPLPHSLAQVASG